MPGEDRVVKPPEEASAARPTSRQARRQKHAAETQAYIDQHELVQFVQSMMQRVLKEKPSNPFEYMEKHLEAAKAAQAAGLDPKAVALAAKSFLAQPPNGASPVKPPEAQRLLSSQGPRKVAVAKRSVQTGLQPTPGKDFRGPGLVIESPSGSVVDLRPLRKKDVCTEENSFRRLLVPHLSTTFGVKTFESPVSNASGQSYEPDWVMQNLNLRSSAGSSDIHYQMMVAGSRPELHFLPQDVTAAIVTCGGLSPGLNAVIREIVNVLFTYGVTKIYGIRGGFKGVCSPDSWIELTPEVVQDIHMMSGTMLQCDRGGPTAKEQVESLRSMGVRQYFIIGGDGTHKGAQATADAMNELKWECSVVTVPKSIDNDIPMLDETFGYDTACTEAKKAIDTAYTEATCNSNCLGLVKLMGRNSGYITMMAALAARNVDICLLPEMNIDFDKVLNHIIHLMQTKKYAVVVVADGVGEQVFGESTGKIDSDIGLWLKSKIVEKFAEIRLPLNVKYLDPTYMIRAVPQNSYDSVYCTVLAQNAVHAAMAGYTGVSVGKVLDRYVLLPLRAINALPAKKVDVKGTWFQRLMLSTQQPRFTPDNYEPKGSTDTSNLDEILAASESLNFETLLGEDDEVRRLCPENLSTRWPAAKTVETPFKGSRDGLAYFNDESWVTGALIPGKSSEPSVCLQMLRAGPRQTLHFAPEEVAAAIVTCGGLCPGLNSVIREVVMLLYAYGVRKVYGIKGGYKGVVAPHTWLTLTPDNVRDIHMAGGTILVADRGNPTEEEMARVLEKKGVKQYFVIGGDGTHRGAMETYQAMQKIGWECSVVGIPKTIDNDIALLDRTFGFNTACTEAKKAIDTAYIEATCNANCIGLVKLMGRHCGYIAMMASLAAQHADICLLPEMHIRLESVLEYAATLLKTQGYAVIVVAEGCGDTMLESSGETDAGGNKKLADVGLWLKEALLNHFKSLKLPLTIKYVDPTYMVRAVPANANDSVYCSILAQGAVHGAMAGYTGITVAKVDEKYVYLPIRTITETPNRKVDVSGPWFQRLVESTGQPNLGVVGLGSAKPTNPSKAALKALPHSFMRDEVRVPETKLTVLDGYGQITTSRPLMRADLLEAKDEIRLLELFHLGERFGKQQIVSPLKSSGFGGTTRFQDNYSWSTQALCTREEFGQGVVYYQMTRAGPREYLHFDPYDPTACAAIVSCGGICPGLNSVIREIVNTLWAYGVRKIFGIRGGFKGVVEAEAWFKLDPDVVQDIHNQGGTILVSDRGNPAHADMAQALKARNVRQYFVLGGDGTHQGAMATFEACLEADHECAVVGVPKTIDNDVPLLDQTFGFDTACTEAMKAVESAYVEATCNANCIGLVKLMGRHCGYITLNACIAEGRVDICLLPEMEVDLQKVLDYTVHLMQTKGHVVIVVAEGCGDTIISGSGEKDAGGNKKLADIGSFIKAEITKHFKKLGLPLTIKFNDPTYMIRSTKPSSFDSVYCSVLAQNAVHAAMAGYSGVTVGKVSERFVYLPIFAITKQAGKRVDVKGSWFRRLRHSTKQASFTPAGDDDDASPKIKKHGGSTQDSLCRNLSHLTSINSLLQVGDEIKRLELANLGSMYKPANVVNPLRQSGEAMLSSNAWTMQTVYQFNKRDNTGHEYFQMLRAGPREILHFEPSACSAIIVTCGGLCPGLNSVIREIVMMLKQYGVPTVYGCKGGYKGMVQPEKWLTLDESVVQDIHLQGGSMLVSDRGNPPHSEIAKVLKERNVRQYFILGGDGTHKGAMSTFQEMQKIGHECAVVGVPKTIDNDVPMIDRSFGFNTACSEAVKAIDSAYVEATCNANCIGLVKLMGRHCGFIAQEATLAARHVDIVMLPEMEVSLPKVLKHCLHLMSTKGYAVIVVAEGCGDTLIKSSGETDAGGNKMLSDVGPWLKDQILAYFKKMQKPLTIKYIDPTYMIRAVPANPNDSIYCTVLGQYAVHGAMAGYTGITVGKVDNSYVMLPIHAITEVKPRRVDVKHRQFERLLHTTQQPDLSPGPGDDWALLPDAPGAKASAGVTAKADPPPEVDTLQWMGIGDRSEKEATQSEEVKAGAQLKVYDGFGTLTSERALTRADLLQPSDVIRRLEVMNLSKKFPSKNMASPLTDFTVKFQDDEAWALQPFASAGRVDEKATPYYQMCRAGPREYLHFDPKDNTSCAAIITCGGLCPGLNAVIREVTMMLFAYGVQKVYGIRGGYKGILERDSWMELTPDMVYDIHMQGGTVLVSDRGNPPAVDMAKALVEHNVRQFFVLGGDGTHRGALQIFTALLDLNHECAVVGVPKTIDNDVPVVDQTFGFDTACTEARKAIDAAYVEATCNANCIGFVKLMGRHSGFVALNAVLAARHVDICLLPEMDTSLEKVLDHCEQVMSTKGYAVIVVAEGCGDTMLQGSGETDAGGNKILADAGPWLKDQIMARFKAKSKPLTIKYIDPTYMVRSVEANAFDSVYCAVLAQHAVHGAMAGYTGITVAKVYERYVYLPIHAITRTPGKRVNRWGRFFARMQISTNQPSFEPDGYQRKKPDSNAGKALLSVSTPLSINDVLFASDVVHRYDVVNLGQKFTSKQLHTPLAHIMDEQLFVDNMWTIETFGKKNSSDTSGSIYRQMMRSGPRRTLHFNPAEEGSCAAIVTCGGLCPGLNNVIRELTNTLRQYGVTAVHGIIGGYKGCVKDDGWVTLTPENVQDIHQQGGSMIVSDRGNPPESEIAQVLARRKVRQFFVLGGDGTHRGAMACFQAMEALGHECAVVGVPKTIDNDIPLLDHSFGFDTACTEAEKAIDSAYIEATTNANCIGLVRLMGRHCGFIALWASLAARHVDICLLPEMNISKDKLLAYVADVMRRKKYAVIVVAEGCGDTIIKGDGSTDAGGNKTLADVGPYLKDEITSYLKSQSIPVTIKYIDPTYMVRSVAANATDSVYTSLLAQHAVHAAMAGYTGCTVGRVDGRYVTLPIHAITSQGSRKVDIKGRMFERLMMTTRQPSFAP